MLQEKKNALSGIMIEMVEIDKKIEIRNNVSQSELRYLRRKIKPYAEGLLIRMALYTDKQLEAVLKSNVEDQLAKMFATAFMLSKEGSAKHFDALLNRILGPVKQIVEVEESQAETMSPAEILQALALAKELRDNKSTQEMKDVTWKSQTSLSQTQLPSSEVLQAVELPTES